MHLNLQVRKIQFNCVGKRPVPMTEHGRKCGIERKILEVDVKYGHTRDPAITIPAEFGLPRSLPLFSKDWTSAKVMYIRYHRYKPSKLGDVSATRFTPLSLGQFQSLLDEAINETTTTAICRSLIPPKAKME